MMLGTCLILASCDNNKPNETTGTSTPETTESKSEPTSESESKPNSESESDPTSETDPTSESESDPISESESDPISESESDPISESESEPTSETEKEDFTVNPSVVYNDPDKVEHAGIDWESGFFANTKHTFDQTKAQSISASDLLAKMVNRDGENALKAGEVWIVSGNISLDESTKYYGNGAAIIVEGKIVIRNAVDVVLKNVIIAGQMDIKNSSGLIFHNVDINSTSNTVTIDANSSDIMFNNCRIFSGNIAVKSGAADLTLYSSYIKAPKGAQLSGDNSTVQNCKLYGSSVALTVSGSDAVIRENTVRAVYYGEGIAVNKGAVNALVALNDISGIERSIVVTEAYNTAVILNRAIAICGADNTNIYIVDNNVGGFIDLQNNNYVICEGTNYNNDGIAHGVRDIENDNVNGNNITDINARPDVGANEDLVPHTNKDLFVGMDRKTTITDASMTTKKGLNAYIKDCAARPEDDIVIVPPGAYSVPSTVTLDSSCSNTTIYAYGVYSECSETNIANYEMFLYYIDRANNLNLYGLTVGTIIPSSGQVRIVDRYISVDVGNGNFERYENEEYIPAKYKTKPREYMFTIVTDAGYVEGFTKANPDIYHTFWPETFLFEDGEYKLYPEENPDNYHTCVKNFDENGNYDGTMTFALKDKTNGTPTKNWKAADIYARVQRGTVMTCRWAYGNHTVYTYGSNNVHVRDFVLYGYSGGMANVAMTVENLKYERFHNALHGETLIDKETYDKYVAIGEKWGVDMQVREEVMPDGTVRYRGPESRSGSIDGFHTTSSKSGYDVVSSLLEGMVDDGANQKGNSSRLWSIKDNGDGTATIEYQDTAIIAAGNVHSTRWCANFEKGDIVFIYAPSGQVLCETPAIEVYQRVGASNSNTLEINGVKQQYSRYSVKVDANAINWDALIDPISGEAYKFQNANVPHKNNQIITVDNLSKNASGFTMDNVIVHNGHSRGFLIKACDVTIKHCTFKNVSYAALLITPEAGWGESTITRRMLIDKCLFENTGYMSNQVFEKEFACISIFGTSTIAREDMLPMDDITITGCKFTNNRQRFAIYLDSVKNVTIKDNIFDDNDLSFRPDVTGAAVLLGTCANIELSDNTYNYAHFKDDINNVVYGNNYVNIFGTDVTGEDGNKLIPDKVNPN